MIITRYEQSIIVWTSATFTVEKMLKCMFVNIPFDYLSGIKVLHRHICVLLGGDTVLLFNCSLTFRGNSCWCFSLNSKWYYINVAIRIPHCTIANHRWNCFYHKRNWTEVTPCNDRNEHLLPQFTRKWNIVHERNMWKLCFCVSKHQWTNEIKEVFIVERRFIIDEH